MVKVLSASSGRGYQEVDVGSPSLADFRTKPVFLADFHNAAATLNAPFSGAAIAAGTSVASVVNQSANNQGIVRLSSAAAANTGYRWQTDLTAVRVRAGIEFECVFTPVSLSAGFVFRVGFLDSATTAAATDGIYIQFAGANGNPALVTRNNGVAGALLPPSGVVITAGTWYRARVSYDGTNATFGVFNATTGVSLWSETTSANIPTAAGRETGAGVVAYKTTAGAAALVDVDWMGYAYSTALSR
jgi:hypothetical protein